MEGQTSPGLPPPSGPATPAPGAHGRLSGSCPVCGAQLDPWADEPAHRPWYRRFAVWMAATVIATVVIASAVLAATLSDEPDELGRMAPSDRSALTQWWSTAYPAVADLADGVDDTDRALQQLDAGVLASACQRMHDAAAVAVPAHLPAPDPEITAELTAAAGDAHAASHMCLSVLERSLNNYDGEFVSTLDQSDRRLRSALDRVNRNITDQ